MQRKISISTTSHFGQAGHPQALFKQPFSGLCFEVSCSENTATLFPKRAERVAPGPRQIQLRMGRDPPTQGPLRPSPPPLRLRACTCRETFFKTDPVMNRALVDVFVCACFFTCFSGFLYPLPPVIGWRALSSNLSSVISLAAAGMWGAWSSGPATKHQHSELNKGTLSNTTGYTNTRAHTRKYDLF